MYLLVFEKWVLGNDYFAYLSSMRDWYYYSSNHEINGIKDEQD